MFRYETLISSKLFYYEEKMVCVYAGIVFLSEDTMKKATMIAMEVQEKGNIPDDILFTKEAICRFINVPCKYVINLLPGESVSWRNYVIVAWTKNTCYCNVRVRERERESECER